MIVFMKVTTEQVSPRKNEDEAPDLQPQPCPCPPAPSLPAPLGLSSGRLGSGPALILGPAPRAGAGPGGRPLLPPPQTPQAQAPSTPENDAEVPCAQVSALLGAALPPPHTQSLRSPHYRERTGGTAIISISFYIDAPRPAPTKPIKAPAGDWAMSANYFQAPRPKNKSWKDEVDQMRRGAADGGGASNRQDVEGHFGSRQLQVRVFSSALRPPARTPAPALTVLPENRFPRSRTPWLHVRNSPESCLEMSSRALGIGRSGDSGLDIPVPALSPLPACPAVLGCFPPGCGLLMHCGPGQVLFCSGPQCFYL